MISGLQLETAKDLIRASGSKPFFFANSSVVTSTAEAPSVSGDDVPAVTDLVSLKAGFKSSRVSFVVFVRMHPSL